MKGVVIIRTPTELRVIHRAVLSSVSRSSDNPAALEWAHVGDGGVWAIDADINGNDDDQTDYAAVAAAIFETITGPKFCTQNVSWTWDAEAAVWGHAVGAEPGDE